jgi:hypothetical protein
MLSRLAFGLGLLLVGIFIGRELARTNHRVPIRLVKNSSEKPRLPERLGPPTTKIVVH